MNRKHICAILIFAGSLLAASCGGGGGVSTGSGGGSNPNPTSSFAFYLSGIEEINGGPNFYALAGSVAIDMTTGQVVDGEQDYNDALGITAANGTITGGMLTVNSTTGQGTLTLTTNNGNLGVHGTETLAVQFVNSKHALIVQFDGSATSSGSFDLQTLPSTLSGGFSFTFSGIDPNGLGAALGGVFTVNGTSISNGEFDVSDASNTQVSTAQPFTGTISSADSFGRGTITNTNIAQTIVYYVVGPEVIRIIDMDTTDSLIGSAYSQGSGTFNASSLGSSVFAIEGSPAGELYAAAGRFSTTPSASPATFTGVGDDDEEGAIASAASISGTYTISAAGNQSGYGTMTFATPLGDIGALGIYMTDPKLNLNDPNNTTSGLGGALVVDLDLINSGGTGVLVPQTDSATASFSGNYAFGAQDSFGIGEEFDFVGQGSVTNGALSGTGDISDPADAFSGTTASETGVSFSGTATLDGVNAGRYTMNPVAIQISGGTPQDFTVVVYQADGGQLFWVDEDTDTLWLGPLEQQPANPTFPLAKTARH